MEVAQTLPFSPSSLKKKVQTLSRFHPISLCNIGYKVITKVIANRLRKILPKIIPENQGGFIHGR